MKKRGRKLKFGSKAWLREMDKMLKEEEKKGTLYTGEEAKSRFDALLDSIIKPDKK